MNKTFYKELLRTIKNTKTRFLSIFVIIALGVGFFAGINATEPDMIISADNYYKENKLSDLTVLFPLDFDKEDKKDILNIDGVSYVEEKIIKDVLIGGKENSGGVLRLYSISEDKTLDKPYITEGREPENKNEILLDASFQDQNGLVVGDNIKITLDDKEDLSDTFYSSEYEVTGFALSPKYVSFERGQTNIGSGSISYFGYLHEDAFKIDSNNLLISMEEYEEKSSYSDEYDTRLEIIEKDIEKLGLSSMKSKEQEIIEEIKEKEEELIEGRQEADAEFKDAEDEITKAAKEINDGQYDIQSAKDKFSSKYNSGILEIEKAKKELKDGRAEYDKNKVLLEDAKVKLDKGERELAQSKPTLDEGKKQLDSAESQLAAAASQLNSGRESLNMFKGLKEQEIADEESYQALLGTIEAFSKDLSDQIKNNVPYSDDPSLKIQINGYMDGYIAQVENELAAGQEEYNVNKAEFDKSKNEYQKGYNEYINGKSELEKQRKVYNDGISELSKAKIELDKGADTLAVNEKKLTDGKVEFEETILSEEEKLEEGIEELEENKLLFEDEKEDVYKEIYEGEEEIEKAYKDLKDIPDNWIITSRQNYPGYASYGDDARRMGAVAKVFPLFFFLVAALVSLTTMTRMVEEERTQIGTFKALGYKTSQVAVKYITYAFTASFFGSILGFSVGFKLFPKVIMIVYGGMYKIPNHVTPFHFNYAIISTLIAVITTVSATLLAMASEMKAMPSVLMQAKAPKPGKRILLERIDFIWSRMSFSNKVTARNVFRYKRRLFMTVLGIAGSMALLLTGFGIRDSVNAINEKQFQEIFIYDGLIFIDEDEDITSIKDHIAKIDEIYYAEEIHSENVTMKSTENVNIEANMMIPRKADNFDQFIDLHSRKGNIKSDIKDGVVITEKLSQLIGKDIGDKVIYENKDGKELEFEISGISENYLAHYIYMNADDYKKISNEDINVNSFVFNYDGDKMPEDFDEDKFKEELLDIDGVQGSLTTAYLEGEFGDTITSLDYVVLILIISAGALSFIVLYNLTNINITERIKEIATIKVLGFRDKEVSAYVYKENIILSVLGTLVGIVLGVILHRFVMVTMEIDSMMFGKSIYFLSYLYSVVLSLSFAVIVNLVMHFRLQEVDMVESLKS